MSKIGRNSYVEKLGSGIVTPAQYREQERIHQKIRQRNRKIERKLEANKKAWSFQPPEPMSLLLVRDCGEVPARLVISVCQRVGAVLLARRSAHIYASDVAADVVLTGTHEQLAEVLGI